MAQKEVAFKIIVDTEQVFPEIENIKKEIDELRKANEKMAEDIKNGFKAAEKGTKTMPDNGGNEIGSSYNAGVGLKIAKDHDKVATGIHGKNFRDLYLFADGHLKCMTFHSTYDPKNMWTRSSDD